MDPSKNNSQDTIDQTSDELQWDRFRRFAEKPTTCNECKQDFSSINEMDGHLNTKHPTLLARFAEMRFYCHFCLVHLTSQEHLEFHLDVHRNIDVIITEINENTKLSEQHQHQQDNELLKVKNRDTKSRCGFKKQTKYPTKPKSDGFKKKVGELHTECSEDFESRLSNRESNISKIEIDMAKSKGYRCDMCEYNVAREFYLKKHVIKIHNKHTQCDECEYTIKSLSELSNHMKFHRLKRRVRTKRNKEQSKKEQSNKEQSNKKIYKCLSCEYTDTVKSHWINHMKTEKHFKCNVCDYQTTTAKLLKYHKVNHTDGKIFQCDHCEFACKFKRNYEYHMFSHTGQKPLRCKLCDYNTVYPTLLKKHVELVHKQIKGKKKYKCMSCDYTDTLKKNLLHHMKIEKHFKCDKCDYQTRIAKSLKYHHISKHTDVKPFKCDKCDFSTKFKKSLKYHSFSHSGEKGFECNKCGYNTYIASVLKKHMKNVHKAQLY